MPHTPARQHGTRQQRQQRRSTKDPRRRLDSIIAHAGTPPDAGTLPTIYAADTATSASASAATQETTGATGKGETATGGVGDAPRVRVAAYCRYSSHMQDDGYSLDYQHEAIARTDAALGHTWRIRMYDEPATSAYQEDIAKRPVFHRMLADCAAGEIDLVVVYSINRLARKQSVSTAVIPALIEAGIQFMTLSEGIDVATPMGRAMMGISSALAELDSDLKGEMVAAAKLQRAKDGLPASRLPYGYQRHPETGVPEPDREGSWPGLMRLFQWCLSGLDDTTVALRLNAEGYRQNTHSRLRNPDGTYDTKRLFTRQTVYAIRTNAFYRPFAPGDDRGTILYNGETYRGQHQAALDWDAWQQMQGMARNRRRGWTRAWAPAAVPYAVEFRGLAVCAECHHRLDVARSRRTTRGTHYEYYFCRDGGRVTECGHHGLLARSEDVRAAWVAWIRAHLTLPDDWQATIRERLGEDFAPSVAAAGAAAAGMPTAAQLHAERLRWLDERERAIDVYLKGWKDEAWASARIAEIDATLAALERAQRPRAAQEARLLDAGTMLVNLADLWMDEDITTEHRILLATHLIAPGGLALDITGVQKRYNPRRPAEVLPPTCSITSVTLQPAFQELLQIISTMAS